MDFASLTVLVVEDQEFVRTIIRKMLEQIGIGTVVDAADGSAALAKVEAEHPHVILCDVQMRPMDGFAFVAALRGLEGPSRIPVIMLTAHADAETVARARQLDVSGFLVKPVLPAALKERIGQALSQGMPAA